MFLANSSSEDFSTIFDSMTIQLLREGYQFYMKHNVKASVCFYALRIAAKYLMNCGKPREKKLNSFFASCLFIASRNPWSHPNHRSKKDFADHFQIKKISSLEWYLSNLVEKLGLIIIYDDYHFPYFLDPEDVMFSVITSVIKTELENSFVKALLEVETFNKGVLIEEIIDILVNRLKVIPTDFSREIGKIVLDLIEKELEYKKLTDD